MFPKKSEVKLSYPRLFAAALGLAVSLSACADFSGGVPLPAQTKAEAVPMPLGAASPPPVGLIGFCLKYMAECAPPAPGDAVVALDDQKLHELEAVQANVNAAIEPRDVPGHAWDYPTDGTGECNEYALEKRRELIDLGWPREALLLTAAYTERGEGHLVLVARTSSGDLVLDNRVDPVEDWSYLPYHWVAQQTSASLMQWVSLAPADQGFSIAAAPGGSGGRQPSRDRAEERRQGNDHAYSVVTHRS